MLINEANELAVRPSMDVYCGIDDIEDYDNKITANVTSGNLLRFCESNGRIQDLGKRVLLTDIEEGFPLNGEHHCAQIEGYEETKKTGWQFENIANENGVLEKGVSIFIGFTKNDSPPSAVTLFFSEGIGGTVQGQIYRTDTHYPSFMTEEIKPQMILETSRKISGIRLDFFEWEPNKRVKIDRIVIGKSWVFDQNTIATCNLILRADLSLDPTIPLSEIEIRGYTEINPLELTSQLKENSTIWYTAGYDGDMSPVRRFLMEGVAEWENNIMTIKGFDQSIKLDIELPSINYLIDEGEAKYRLYNFAKDILNTSKIKYTAEANPLSWKQNITYSLTMFLENARTRLSTLMLSTGWEYVDAGLPELRHIERNITYTGETSSVKMTAERKVKRVLTKIRKSFDEGEIKIIETVETKVNAIEERSFSEFYLGLTVTNATIITKSLNTIVFKATSTRCEIKGRKITFALPIEGENTDILGSTNEDDTTLELSEKLNYYYKFLETTSISKDIFSILKDSPNGLMKRSVNQYEFAWRGNPHMQPLDLFYIRHLEQMIKIEEITLEHLEGGVLTSKVKGREWYVD